MIDDSQNHHARSPAECLASYIDFLRFARNDDSAGTQQNINSGANRSNARSAIYSLTQNSTSDATPNNSTTNNFTEDLRDDYSSSSRIPLSLHQRAKTRNRNLAQRLNIKGEERSTLNYGNDKEVNNARDADAEEINTTRTSDNRSSDNADRTNNKMETASNLDRTAVQTAELRAVQAQWDAGNYIVGNTNDVRNTRMINTPSDTTIKNDAQRTTASSSHPSCAPSLNGSILSAGKQNSIQFQWMPSEAMKNYAMHWSWRHCAPS